MIDGIEIFECENCQLASLNQNKIINSDYDHLYNFEAYKKQEGQIRERLNKLLSYITKSKNKGKVLEIGSGYGLLSSILYDKGDYEIQVLEPELEPYYLKNKQIIHHKLDIDRYLHGSKESFDLIIMMDVIEHFEDPFLILSRLTKLLNKDGIMVIQTPNYKSLMQQTVKKWSWWMVEDHKWFFSTKSLIKTLDMAKLKAVFTYTYEDWEDYKKNLDGNFSFIENTYLRKFTKGITYSLYIPLYFLLKPIIWRLGYGGLIFTIARK